jgi:hypothetical protein
MRKPLNSTKSVLQSPTTKYREYLTQAEYGSAPRSRLGDVSEVGPEIKTGELRTLNGDSLTLKTVFPKLLYPFAHSKRDILPPRFLPKNT